MCSRDTAHVVVSPAARLQGALSIPGDKSVGHRALMIGALCDGVTQIENLPDGADNHSTRAVLAAIGTAIDYPAPGVARVVGMGAGALCSPDDPLDCGNSGTTIRLMAGLLAGQGLTATLTGDASLSGRPMGRVVQPLEAMGFDVGAAGEGGTLPLHVRGRHELNDSFAYDSPVASAQVKSCVLLAGLRSTGDIVVREPAPSRDHTERLLRYLGYRVEASPNYQQPDGQSAYVRLYGPGLRTPSARPIYIPGDISSAAFFMVAAAVAGSGEVVLEGVSINPTRTGILDVLPMMGVGVTRRNLRVLPGNEPVADIVVHPNRGALRGVRIDGGVIPRAIDELPVLAVLAALAEGETVMADAAELRVKESDRIAATVALLRAAGADAEETDDGLRIAGGARFRGFEFDAGGDHRLAMAATVAALAAEDDSTVVGVEACAVSYPGFFEDLARLTGVLPVGAEALT